MIDVTDLLQPGSRYARSSDFEKEQRLGIQADTPVEEGISTNAALYQQYYLSLKAKAEKVD